MKKLIALLMATTILFALGCGAKSKTETAEETTSVTEITTTVQTEPATEAQAVETTEKETVKPAAEFSDSFKKEYCELLASGNYYQAREFTDSENRTYIGTLFAEIFDWNLDGVPELMIGYASDDEISYNIETLDVYTIKNDKADLILSTDVHSSYGALDGSQSIGFSRGEDGTIYLSIDNDETEEMSVLGETYYSFKDGKVEYTRFYAEMDVDWDNGADTVFHDFKIDGKNVTEKQFNDKRKEMGEDDIFCAVIGYCDYSMLVDYLAGNTETYKNQFFHIYHEENPSWLYEVKCGF